MLFSLYINDLPLNIPDAKTVLFADDTNVLITGENITTLSKNLNNVVSKIQQWFSLNNLIINTDKTKVIHFHNYQNKLQVLSHLLIKDSLIPTSTDTKFLGIHVNKNLKWSHHCDSLKSKLNTGY